jgi:glycosyltransferase involved in cell wall biosynthesis
MEYLGGNKPINRINPLVSVCVPTFCHGPYIRACLESILDQKTDFPFEILIGEDDGDDETRQICMELAQVHQEKIRLFLRKASEKVILFGRKSGRGNHLGLYRSARGKYVCICDGDDLWIDSQKLTKQVNVLEQNPEAVMCITNTRLDGHPEQNPPGVPDRFRIFTSKSLKKTFYMGHISSWMMRNEMEELLSNEIVKKPIPLDQVIYSFYKQRGQVIYIPDITSFYRFNPTGIYLSRSKRKNQGAVFRHSWYLFRYLHKDPFLWLRSVFYFTKRYLINLFWYVVKEKEN